jgi:hypothetical protein
MGIIPPPPFVSHYTKPKKHGGIRIRSDECVVSSAEMMTCNDKSDEAE